MVADDVEGIVNFTPAFVAPGDTALATVVHTVTQDELDAGFITNTATATATFGAASFERTDAVTVTATRPRRFDFVKTGAPATYDAVGDTSSPTPTSLKNTGNVTLSGPFTVDRRRRAAS